MSTPESLTDAWLRFWSPTFNLPGSGGIGSFNYHPNTTWGAPTLFSGNEIVEQAVYRDIATPGKQLGRLSDVVRALIDELSKMDSKIADAESVKKFKEMSKQIEKIKAAVEDNTVVAVKEGLEKLKHTDKDAFDALMKEYAVSAK